MNKKRSDAKQVSVWVRVIVTCTLLVLIGALVAPISTRTATDVESSLDPRIYLPLVFKRGPPRLKILFPLYSYPNHRDPDNYIWDDIAAANSQEPITAIINPNSGPLDDCLPEVDYQNYLTGTNELRDGNVPILGYVSTSYTIRSTIEVTADVDSYIQCFDIDGIFYDKVAPDAAKCDYYRDLCHYAKSLLNLDTAFLNPGIWPDECYFQTGCDTVVVFENYGNMWPNKTPPAYAERYSPEYFAMLAHTVPDTYTMRSMIDLAVARNIRYVYVTDDTNAMNNPYSSLPRYWQDEIDYIGSINCGGQPRSYSGSVLSVAQTESEVVVANTSRSPVAIRCSWDHRDPYGNGEGEESYVDNWVVPGEVLRWPIKDHTSVQCWAWDTSAREVDKCDLFCFR